MVPTGAGTGSVFVLDTLPHVPFYQDGWGRQSHSFTFTQNLGGVVLNDTGVVFVEQGSYPLGGHTYRYHVEVDEPFYLRSGSTTFVHVGSYVLDNGLTGPVGAQGNADNLGEGQGFRFYANPPAPHAPSTAISTTSTTADVSLSGYDIAPSGAVELPNGGAMSWRYELHLYRARCPSLSDLSACTIGAEVSGSPHRTAAVPAIWAGLPAGSSDTGTCYWPQVRIDYVVAGALHLSSEAVPTGDNPGDYNNVFCLKIAAAFATATPLPPTATPTPARGAATLAQTVVPYAWVRTFHSEDPAAQDRLYASTWRQNPDPATFYWPVGRPLHLLPAVDENPTEALLTIHDLGNGGSAALYPRSVVSTDYTLLDAGALGGSHCVPSGYGARQQPYLHDPRYPAAIDPFSPRIVLVWAPAGLAGTLPATTVRCDLAPLLGAGASGPSTLSYRIHERLAFAARFSAAPPRLGGATDCAGELAPLPAATPFSAEPGVPAPPPAFTGAQAPTGPCPGGDVGLVAAIDALDRWPTQVSLSGPGGAITGLSYTVAGTLVQISVTVERTVALRYHLLVSREVQP